MRRRHRCHSNRFISSDWEKLLRRCVYFHCVWSLVRTPRKIGDRSDVYQITCYVQRCAMLFFSYKISAVWPIYHIDIGRREQRSAREQYALHVLALCAWLRLICLVVGCLLPSSSLGIATVASCRHICLIATAVYARQSIIHRWMYECKSMYVDSYTDRFDAVNNFILSSIGCHWTHFIKSTSFALSCILTRRLFAHSSPIV